MYSRRNFIKTTTIASAGLVASTGLAGAMDINSPFDNKKQKNMRFNFPEKFGLGGVAAGNGFHTNKSDQINAMYHAAWNNGVRYFDTSPWYGLGLSERRLGHFLFEKPREEFILSTKVGRVLEADDSFTPNDDLLWKGRLNFKHRYDYTAGGVRRSIEDSLQRLGLSSIDIVFVHDLSPDNGDLGSAWTEQFEIAKKGAFPELTKMREEGIIKGWGLGVNTPQPIMNCIEVADPDVMLVAIQYSLVEHKNALNKLFPALEKRNIPAVIGGPINAGFLANRNRFNYGSDMPVDMVAKRKKLNEIIEPYKIDLRTVALQFCASHPQVGAVIPGASLAEQVKENVQSFKTEVPDDLWNELKAEKLIEKNAIV